MGAALPNHDALDGGIAFRAGQTGPLVHTKMVLEIAAAVNPVNAGAVTADAFVEHGAQAP